MALALDPTNLGILASRAAPRSVPHFLKPLGQALNISLNFYQFDINFLC
jgi:hypothetical protein